jgi:hypothetical protein
MTWHEAIKLALKREKARRPHGIIRLQDFKDQELGNIVRDTRSRGKTPGATLERVFQELRDQGTLEFLDNDGTYRIV